eukprot:6216317-Prymnesium_polylepis.1
MATRRSASLEMVIRDGVPRRDVVIDGDRPVVGSAREATLHHTLHAAEESAFVAVMRLSSSGVACVELDQLELPMLGVTSMHELESPASAQEKPQEPLAKKNVTAELPVFAGRAMSSGESS